MCADSDAESQVREVQCAAAAMAAAAVARFIKY